MGENDSILQGVRSRLGAWRGNRRQTGVLAAALLAVLAGSEPTAGRGKKRSTRRANQGNDIARKRRRCGGIAGIPCPKKFVCVDDPGDDCDPKNGGADCGGVCVPRRRDPCATIRCRDGFACCSRCGGLCIPRDVPCTGSLCRREPCNEAVCGPGEYCCNESCSRCTPLGGACTDEVCPPAQGEPCGDATCGKGEYCCNPSCGICAPLDGGCHQAICDPYDPPLGECGPVVCPAGQVCCNASCGACTPPGGACTMIACVDEPAR